MKIIKFPVFQDSNGSLAVFEGGLRGMVPFDIARVFSVTANVGDFRGNHAHYQCTQLLICLAGKILVKCFDGNERQEIMLDEIGQGLLISPGVWASQEYLIDNSLMIVLCDRGYEEEDYIRDFQTFINYKSGV